MQQKTRRPRKGEELHTRFSDNDLTTPAHDEMVLWVGQNLPGWLLEHYDNRERADAKRYKLELDFRRALGNRIAELQKRQEELAGQMTQAREEVAAGTATLHTIKWIEDDAKQVQGTLDGWQARLRAGIDRGLSPVHQVEQIRYEVPVMNGNYITGWIDVTAEVKEFWPYLDGIDRDDKAVPYLRGDSRPDKVTFGYYGDPVWFGFECNPTIPSLGELLRRLRRYQTYMPRKYTVVSPDTRFADVLVEQGFGFWESPTFS